MKTFSQITGLVLLFALATTPVSAATYKYQDESGNTVYSQNPPDNPNTPYEVMGGVRSHARPGSNTPPSSVPSSSSGQQDSATNETIARKQEEAEKIRKENCAAAKKNLEVYTVFRRVRNEDGEVVRMDDKERQQKIDDAKQAIQDFCD